MQQKAPAIRIVSVILFSTLWACLAEQSNAQSVKQGTKGDLSQYAASGCDASLWNHVYNPKRLNQLAPCLTVTGIITESSIDADGDQHFLLRLDPGQESLVNKRNRKKKCGDIVLEIVCANPTTMKKVKSACAGYTNRIPIAAVGAHVRATGTYVIDSHNGWAEIHPVSKLQAM
ncbi:MAG: hypothetical protein M3P26_13695 [Gemmatimonadota bacterium]|nr:hypothetical protein [Gemmatimonadota bacterium]